LSGSELACRLRFWSADLRRGAPIARQLADVRRTFADPALGRELAAARLRRLLQHAGATTAFYRRWAGRAELAAFPVVRKRSIQENPGAFLSATVERKGLLTVSTSGSYGAPLRLQWTVGTYVRRRAELLYFGSWAGFHVGAPFAQVTVDPRGSVRLPGFNGFLVDPSVIDEAWLEAQRRLVKEARIAFIVGYPSSIKPLADYCRARGDGPGDFRLRGVVASSEALLPGAREAIAAAFGCPVFDRYGANELGILAQECPGAASHHVNVAGHVVEVLERDRDEAVRPGEPGRVVVTDLFSHAMPLIRYDTGDVAVASEGPCACGRSGPLLTRIEGRRVEEIRDPDGALVNPLAIGGCPKDLEGLIQYQFVQRRPDRYLVRLHALPSFHDEATLRERFQRLLGPRAAIEIEYVPGIPPLPSGKRPYILSELAPRAR
jgi:phenylacetate-CoA ligase